MPRGVKTTNESKAKIMASYALTNSYNATAKELGISDSTVKSIIEKNKEEFKKVQEQKKEEFSKQADKIIDKALTLLDRRYDTALNNQEELEEMIQMAMYDDDLDYKEKMDIIKKLRKIEVNSLSEITTSLGTLYDKARLAKGESTSNDDINVNIKVV